MALLASEQWVDRSILQLEVPVHHTGGSPGSHHGMRYSSPAMARGSTTAGEDAERLREELPEIVSAPLEGTARVVEGAARLGLEATLWPFRLLPRSVRDGLSQGLRAGLAVAAMVPHALTRAVRETADRLAESRED